MVLDGKPKEGNWWLEKPYNPEWYNKDYFTEYPYHEYQDYGRHDVDFDKFMAIMNPKSVLDVGCAYGYIVKRCLDRRIHAIGVDISKWCEEQADKVIPQHFICTPAWDLHHFGDKEFDVLYCQGMLEHIPEDKIDLVIKEFARVAHRRYLGVSPDCPQTDYHICNHNIQWWFDRVPPMTWLGETGRSLDVEDRWLIKT